jgi:hypothetical protein
MKMSHRSIVTGSLFALGLLASAAAHADVTYKCPGNTYSNTISAKEAKDKGCSVLEGKPITVIQGTKPRAASSGQASGPAATRIDPAEQRARDSDARRILETELKREEDRLVAMQAEYNNGTPERQGNEANFQKYLDRVIEMKAAIARKEGDILALKREIAKLPQ